MGGQGGRNVVGTMALHAAIAGVFFFVLQRYGNSASIEVSSGVGGFLCHRGRAARLETDGTMTDVSRD